MCLESLAGNSSFVRMGLNTTPMEVPFRGFACTPQSITPMKHDLYVILKGLAKMSLIEIVCNGSNMHNKFMLPTSIPLEWGWGEGEFKKVLRGV